MTDRSLNGDALVDTTRRLRHENATLRAEVVRLLDALDAQMAHLCALQRRVTVTRLKAKMPQADSLTVALTWGILKGRGLLSQEEEGSHGLIALDRHDEPAGLVTGAPHAARDRRGGHGVHRRPARVGDARPARRGEGDSGDFGELFP